MVTRDCDCGSLWFVDGFFKWLVFSSASPLLEGYETHGY